MGCFGHAFALERSRKRRVTSGGSRCEQVLEARQVNKKLNRKLSLNREIYTPPVYTLETSVYTRIPIPRTWLVRGIRGLTSVYTAL